MLTALHAKELTIRERDRHDAEHARPLIAEVEAMIRAAIARRQFMVSVAADDAQRFNSLELTNYLREAGYSLSFGTPRKPRFVVSWGGAVAP
jgi:hypothetical protein